MTRFRTHKEMDDIYQGFAERGERSWPYLLEYTNNRQILNFFGSKHSTDSSDSQWSILEAKWADFAAHDNDKKILVYERQDFDIKDETRDTALAKYSESGLAVWLAKQTGIPSTSGEPSIISEIEHLKQKYSLEEIVTYYFGRQMLQWLTQDFEANPDWRKYATNTLEKYDSLDCWEGKNITLDNALAWFSTTTGKDFDSQDRQTLYSLSDPSQSEVSSASGMFRDAYLFQQIQEKWQTGYDVFVIYGSGHAIVLEPALKDLAEKG